MPATHHCSYPVRHCECDAFGLLSPVSSLRYLQETAYGASAAVGYGMVRYQQEGRFWYIRETWVDFLSPVYYGQVVEAKSWVTDFHRVRSLRAYELAIAGVPVLDAWSDWVYMDSISGRPISVPQEMMAAFCPEGASSRPRLHFPPLPAVPSRSFRNHLQAEWGALDAIWHVNNSLYVDYLENNRRSAMASIGWTPERMRQQGFDVRIRRIHMEYRQPAFLHENLEIITWTSGFEDGWLRLHGSISTIGCEGDTGSGLLFRAHAWLQVIDIETLKPRGWPSELLNDLRTLLITGGV